MPDLPHDVWMQIADLLTVKHLVTLVAVNRSFYNIVLDMRYGEIHWVRLDNYMLKSLIRLQDSLIAERVRRLHIRAWFVQYLTNSSPKAPSPDALSNWTSDQISTISRHLTNFKKKLFPSATICLHATPPKPQDPQPWRSSHIRVSSFERRLRHALSRSSNTAANTPSLIIPMMLAAFQCMTNLIEYDFEWRDLPLNPATQSFIPSNPATLSSLQKLVLHAQLPQFKDIFSQFMLKLPNLQDLDLYFDYTPPSITAVAIPSEITQAFTLKDTILTTVIAPFIASLRPSLSSLTISSSAAGDHSCLFNSLGQDPFPHLHALAVRIPFDNDHLSDTEGLMYLLQTNAGTLLRVELRPGVSGEITLENGGPWSRMSQACRSLTFLMVFTNLESLTLPVHELQFTLSLVKRSANILNSLCLLGKLLTEDEVREVIQVFNEVSGGKLKKLDICVKNLTSATVGLLAAGLPALSALVLVLDKDFNLLTFMPGEIQKHDWGLDDLSIYLGRSRGAVEGIPVADTREREIMSEVRKWIPNVKSFKQQGI